MLKNILKDKKVFIFDLDGTLIESLNLWSDADCFIIKQLTGITVDPVELGHERDAFLGSCKSDSPYSEYLLYLMESYNINFDFEALRSYRKTVCYKMLDNVKLKPCAIELLQLLKSSGYKLALATSGAKGSVRRVLHEIDATKVLGDNIFDVIMMQADVDNLKPAPDVHNKIKEVLGFSDNEAVVIEDSIVGIMAAKNANLDCIVVREDYHPNQEDIKKNAQVYVNSLEEIYNYMKNLANNGPKLR